MSTTSCLHLKGLDCADCAAKLEKKLSAQLGVEEAKINFALAKLNIRYNGKLEEIIRTVEESGYSAEIEQGMSIGGKPQSWLDKHAKTMLTVLSGIFTVLGFSLTYLGLAENYIIPLYILAIVSGGFYLAKSGIFALKTYSLDMNLLMTIAVIGAASIGEWAEAATVVFLFALGNALQAYTLEKTRNSIRALMDLTPQEGLIRRVGHELKLPLAEIKIGDILLVKPGERIAMDGRVINGQSSVNQAPITGEAVPVVKQTGSEVFAGTLNGQGALEVEITKLVGDTTLAKIIHLVEEAQAQKAPSQQFVDVFAKYYTPLVIFTAIVIAIIPYMFFAQPFGIWFKKALILLVISCPCALVISTPVSILAAISSAAKKGVLIKGGAHLEAAGSLRAIAFDKTGTLTMGKPEVVEVKAFGNNSFEDILAIAGSIESRSQHPLAEAILQAAEFRNIPIIAGQNFQAIHGKGAQAELNGQSYYIGNPRLFQDLGVELTHYQDEIERLQQKGNTVMVVGAGKQVAGLIAVADMLRTNSTTTIQALKRTGIRKIIMLTGDNESTARQIANQSGVDEFRAELLPAEKLTVIKELMQEYGQVGMVGDGINDAPALAAATVGIAMGGAGTDTALETADIALMADDLAKLPYTIKLSRLALRVIKQNIAFALIVKAVFLFLTFLNMATLWMAVFADTGAALLVIANGMRLFAVKDTFSTAQKA